MSAAPRRRAENLPCSKSFNTKVGQSQERQPAGVIKAPQTNSSAWAELWTSALVLAEYRMDRGLACTKDSKQHLRSHCTQWLPSPGGRGAPHARSSRQPCSPPLRDGCGLFVFLPVGAGTKGFTPERSEVRPHTAIILHMCMCVGTCAPSARAGGRLIPVRQRVCLWYANYSPILSFTHEWSLYKPDQQAL